MRKLFVLCFCFLSVFSLLENDNVLVKNSFAKKKQNKSKKKEDKQAAVARAGIIAGPNEKSISKIDNGIIESATDDQNINKNTSRAGGTSSKVR